MWNFNISDFLNYAIKFILIILCVYFYATGSLSWNRLVIFIIVFLIITGYVWITQLIFDFFNNKKVQNYVKSHDKFFRKLLYILLEIHR